MVELVQQVVTEAAKSGQCVIVGRGAPYFLRERSDTLSVFLYAPRAWKVQRIEAQLGSRAEAERLVESVDRGRAAFVKHYFGKDWPTRYLYHLMLNTVIGIEPTLELLMQTLGLVTSNDATRAAME